MHDVSGAYVVLSATAHTVFLVTKIISAPSVDELLLWIAAIGCSKCFARMETPRLL